MQLEPVQFQGLKNTKNSNKATLSNAKKGAIIGASIPVIVPMAEMMADSVIVKLTYGVKLGKMLKEVPSDIIETITYFPNLFVDLVKADKKIALFALSQFAAVVAVATAVGALAGKAISFFSQKINSHKHTDV